MMKNCINRVLHNDAYISAAEKIFCLVMALVPVISVYNFPVLNVSIGTVMLFVLLPYVLLKLYVSRSVKEPACVMVLLAFYIYLAFRAEGNIKKILLYIPTFTILWGVLKGALNEKCFRRYLEGFACINAAVIIFQTVLFYLLNAKVSFVAYSWLQRDYLETYAGVAIGGNMYRPSGLFLEPSFFSQYALFALISCLFPMDGKMKIKQAGLICMGIVCSTSGMGMLLTAFVIAWRLLISRDSWRTKLKRIAIAGVIALAAVLILSMLPFFRQALQRVFSKLDGYNALDGRIGHWGTAISSLHGLELLYGLGGEHKFVFYLTGMPTTIYQYGLIGATLLLAVFASLMLKKRTQYVLCCSVMFLVLFCVANLTNLFSLLFYFSIVMANAISQEKDDEKELESRENMSADIHSGMVEITGEEVKQIAFEILKDVAAYCELHGLQYYLVCGTALGAVRHNGFIPWDDDIDIGMPRPDYEKFLTGYQSDNYYLLDARSGKAYPYAFAKVCDKRTVLVEKVENPFPMGVYIDVFPIDGIPSNPQKQKWHLFKIDWDLRLLSWKRISKEKKLDRIHKIVQSIAKTVLAPVPFTVLVKKLDRDLKAVPYASSEVVGHLASKAYWGDDRKPKQVLEPPAKYAFEDQKFWIPGDYDAYLTLEYGDYMKLPPVEKQVCRHDFVAYWKNKPE